jgi:hypothetical protein
VISAAVVALSARWVTARPSEQLVEPASRGNCSGENQLLGLNESKKAPRQHRGVGSECPIPSPSVSHVTEPRNHSVSLTGHPARAKRGAGAVSLQARARFPQPLGSPLAGTAAHANADADAAVPSFMGDRHATPHAHSRIPAGGRGRGRPFPPSSPLLQPPADRVTVPRRRRRRGARPSSSRGRHRGCRTSRSS